MTESPPTPLDEPGVRRGPWSLLLWVLLGLLVLRVGISVATVDPAPFTGAPELVLLEVRGGTATVHLDSGTQLLDTGASVLVEEGTRIEVGPDATVTLTAQGGAEQVLCGGAAAVLGTIASTTVGDLLVPELALVLLRGIVLVDTASRSLGWAPLSIEVDSGPVVRSSGEVVFAQEGAELLLVRGDVDARGTTPATVQDVTCDGPVTVLDEMTVTTDSGAGDASGAAGDGAVEPDEDDQDDPFSGQTDGSSPAPATDEPADEPSPAPPSDGIPVAPDPSQPLPDPDPSSTPDPDPAPEPDPDPAPDPVPDPDPAPDPDPSPDPVPPSPDPDPPSPSPDPSPDPTPSPTEPPAPSPEPTVEPGLRWVDCSPPQVRLKSGRERSRDTTCVLASSAGFAGTVSLSCTTGSFAVRCAPERTTVVIPADGQVEVDVIVTATRLARSGTYTATVTATGGDLTTSRTISVQVR